MICSFAITGGADPLCANITSTYYLDATVPSGTSTQWVVSSNLQIISFTNNSVTIKELTSSTATITANINNPCGANVVVTRTIEAGPPVITSITSTMTGGCNGTTQEWMLNAYAGSPVSSWLWTVDNPSNHWVIYSPNQPNTLVAVTGGGGITISATNACGTGRGGVTIWSNCYAPYALTASPNPATNNVTVAMAQPKQSTAKQSAATTNTKKVMIYKIILTDQLGSVKRQYNYSAGVNSAIISLSGLVSGTYTIQAFDGVIWNTVQVIKQ